MTDGREDGGGSSRASSNLGTRVGQRLDALRSTLSTVETHQKVDPTPSWLSTPIRPPINLTICIHRAKKSSKRTGVSWVLYKGNGGEAHQDPNLFPFHLDVGRFRFAAGQADCQLETHTGTYPDPATHNIGGEQCTTSGVFRAKTNTGISNFDSDDCLVVVTTNVFLLIGSEGIRLVHLQCPVRVSRI